MSAVAALIGLALTTAAAVVVLSVVNGHLTTNWSSQLSGNNSNGQWTDPNGPSVQFILFTRHLSPFNLQLGNASQFSSSGFSVAEPTKIIIHGYLSSINEDVFVVNKNAYLESGNYNVIGMDWSPLCRFEYFSAMRGVKIAGHYLGEFLNWLAQMGVPLESIHIIGHSMGAHVAGIGGSNVKKGKIARITGLDPAKPGYSNNTDLVNKLDTEDAALVDVIHTYMQILSLPQPIGHIDFYPNGGKFQPGCPNLAEIWTVPQSLLCNHKRAYQLFAEAIRNNRAFKCKRCNSVDDAFYGRCNEETDVYMGHPESYIINVDNILECFVESEVALNFKIPNVLKTKEHSRNIEKLKIIFKKFKYQRFSPNASSSSDENSNVVYDDTTDTENKSSDLEKHSDEIKIFHEQYYAIFYEEQWYIGRILEMVDGKYKIKILKTKQNYLVWPKEDDMALVDSKYIFYGPIELIGSELFELKRCDNSNIMKMHKLVKKKLQDIKVQ